MDATGAADGGLTAGLRQYATARFSGVLRVDGQPGGAIHLVDGGISACQTSGAPSLEVILLRSGRVAESDWNAAFTEAAIAERPMTAELVERGLLGAGEVEALLRVALADAMFALTCGRVDSWTETLAADYLLPLDPAARAGWLLAEATRRRHVLASFPAPLMSAADRIAVAHAAVPPGRVLGHGQDDVPGAGRRTAHPSRPGIRPRSGALRDDAPADQDAGEQHGGHQLTRPGTRAARTGGPNAGRR